MERLRNAATPQPPTSPTLAISMLFHSCRLFHSGCWLLGVALTAKTVVRHVCDTLCNIPYAQL